MVLLLSAPTSWVSSTHSDPTAADENLALYSICSSCAGSESPAQEPALHSADSVVSIVAEINASGNIRIEQPATLAVLLQKRAENTAGDEESVVQDNKANSRSGYRIQVFDDNNPRTAAAQAKARGHQMEASFPQYKTYVSFNSPYWRVKVGDFRTRGEAEAAMADIREAYPQFGAYLRIVRDRINIFD